MAIYNAYYLLSGQPLSTYTRWGPAAQKFLPSHLLQIGHLRLRKNYYLNQKEFEF